MMDNNSDISVTRLDTGEIACIRYEQTTRAFHATQTC